MEQATPALVEYGALGILALFLGIAVRILFQQVQKDKERETERADRNEEALREANRAMQERLIPTALDMLTTTKRLIELMAHQQAERRRRREDEP